MVLGIIVYQFDLNQSKSGEIEPKFRIVASSTSYEYEGPAVESIVSDKEKFRLFFDHTTGLSSQLKGRSVNSTVSGRFKGDYNKYLSYYQKTENELQFMTIALFERETEIEIVENLFQVFISRLEAKLAVVNPDDINNFAKMNEIQNNILHDIKFCIFQMERLSNLSKLQKVALIFGTYEREYCLHLLRESPISRENLIRKLEKFNKSFNIDVLLKPFIELNIIRRDWVKGVKNKRTGVIQGQGEYIFLIKDIALVQAPPQELIETMKDNRAVGPRYLKEVTSFYENYSPFEKMDENSLAYARLLLDPDIFDVFALLKNRAYPLKKIPSIISEFSQMDEVLEQLVKFNLVKIIKDDQNMEWACLIGEITPLIVFPEYIINNIADRSAIKLETFDEKSMVAPLTKEIGQVALNLLELSYEEKVEF